MTAAGIEADANIIDFARGPTEQQEGDLRGEDAYKQGYLNTVFDPFVGRPTRGVNDGVRRYESQEIPGKAPGLLTILRRKSRAFLSFRKSFIRSLRVGMVYSVTYIASSF